MVRLSKSLAVRATRALRVGLGGRDQPQMNKVNMYVPGFDKESLKHNWSALVKKFKRPTFPPEIWSVYDRTVTGEPRTNNQLEGWHRRFKTVVDKHHPNIFVFVDRLKGEQAHTETIIDQLIGGMAPQSMRQKLLPLFVCSVIGCIVAARYSWHTVKPSKDTEEYTEPYIFAFKFFGDNRVPMFPKMSKKKEEAKKE